MTGEDRKFMELAIVEAGKSISEDERPHPKVGVVVVKQGTILAKASRGETEPGRHAEYVALEQKLSIESLAGATVYTTLEPCTTRNHPKVPCADRLVERRVARVVIGMLDPDVRICGRGIRRLREANIQVDLFPKNLMAQVEEQNREFIRHRTGPSVETAEAVAATTDSSASLKNTPRAAGGGSADPLRRIQVAQTRLTCCVWLPGDSAILTAGFSGALCKLSFATGGVEAASLGNTVIRCITSVPSPAYAVTGDDFGRVLLIDTNTFHATELARARSSVFSIDYVPERSLLYLGERNGAVSEWTLSTDPPRARHLRVVHRHEGASFTVRFDSQLSLCRSVGADGMLRTTSLQTGQSEVVHLSEDALFALDLRLPRIVAGDSVGRLFLVMAGARNHLMFEGHQDALRSADLSPTGEWGITASKDGTVRAWHLSSGRSWILAESNDYLYDVQLAGGSDQLAACDGGGALILASLGRAIDEMSPDAFDRLVARH